MLAGCVCALAASAASGQLYDRLECGGVAVNWAKEEISKIEPSDPREAARLERIVDLFWTDPEGRWCSSTGERNTGWGDKKGLAYFALYDLGRVYRELEWSGVRFSRAQRKKIEGLLASATRAAADGTYYYFGKCNLWAGRINIDNTCGEDDMSIAKFLAMIHNLYPEIARQCGGTTAVAVLERRFFEKAFSSDYEHGGGLLVIRGELTLPNHGGPSWPYAAINLIGANNARDTYLLAGNPLPDWYLNPNALALFARLQLRAHADGSAFTDDCVSNRGKVEPCNDPGLMNAVPTMLPAGRFIRAVFGDNAFAPGRYTFETCDPAVMPSGDRLDEYCAWNPGVLPLGVIASARSRSTLELRWTPTPGATAFDVWLLGALVAGGDAHASYTAKAVSCGAPVPYGVIARDERRRTLGGQWGEATIECPAAPPSPRP